MIPVLGTVGNVFATIVMSQKVLTSSTTSMLIRVVAAADTAVLWVDLGRQWSRKVLDFDIRTVSNVSCKVSI